MAQCCCPIILILRVLNLISSQTNFFLCLDINDSLRNCISSRYEKLVWFLNIGTNVASLDANVLVVDYGKRSTANVDRVDIEAQFRSNHYKGDTPTLTILDLNNLLKLRWHHINWLSSSVYDAELLGLDLSLLAIGSCIVKVEELAVEDRDTYGLLMVDQEDEADLLANIITIVTSLLTTVAFQDL